MPGLPHLILPRVVIEPARKKTGFGQSPARDYRTHGPHLRSQLDGVLTQFRNKRPLHGINPNLILRVQLNPKSAIDEETWERSGLALLSIDENKTLVLFSSDEHLTDFSRRMTQYQSGPSPQRKGAPYSQLFASIDEIGEVRPQDRIGRLLRSQGVTSPSHFEQDKDYVVDIEFWDLGSLTLCAEKIKETRIFIDSQGGRTSDEYIGESLVLLRSRCRGEVVRELLEIDSIASIDLPPQPTLTVGEYLNLGLEDFAAVPSPPEESPAIAILDSGLTSAHPFLEPAVGEATAMPQSLGDAADGHGHGTMVAGLALYGDIEGCIHRRAFVPQLKLYSARVLNEQCEFDDEYLITSQMRNAIEYFNKTYGCRVFNLSLGDRRLPYQGGKVSPWASILDTLARELNVILVVSAGNYNYDPGPSNSADSHLLQYPYYLLSDDARIIEPATGAVVLTVGSLAQSANIPPGSASQSVSFQPIALQGQPSPFSRSGPGLGGAIKPELCEYGGNYAFDGTVQGVRRNIHELSMVSFNHDYVSRLFTTDVGTSYSAPRVAHVAARLFEAFPEASANLIRALLAASASVPQPALDILNPLGDEAVLRVCGYGKPNLEYSETSDENRVVLYADSELGFDNFHIYELPIPVEFINTNGVRSIIVTLAFDPPVRHSRFDYLGIKMSFRLIRGKTVEEIVEAFRQRTNVEGTVDRLTSTSFDCQAIPKPGLREGGTLQCATFTMRRTPQTDYGDTYFLVVRCEKKWAREEHAPQRYAVVAVMKHSADVNLYNRIRERVAIRLRTQETGRS
ncbi:MAG: S8 family peptidase [Deltaproteobacteria bacterium]|nr:S8 family peptidase [Deltaproteobacteria bacterium]